MIHLFDDLTQQIVLLLPQGDKLIDPSVNQKKDTADDG